MRTEMSKLTFLFIYQSPMLIVYDIEKFHETFLLMRINYFNNLSND